jgi:hypothetical protein
MLAHYIKSVLELVPEAMPMLKQASIDKDLPTDGRDSCVASALAVEYMIKIAHKPVGLNEMEKVAEAVHLYGVDDEVRGLKSLMVKRAHDRQEADEANSTHAYLLKEASFWGDLSGMCDTDVRANKAEELYKEAGVRGIVPSEEVRLYSCHGTFSKESAVKSLSVRHSLTGNGQFIKLASAIASSDMTPELVAKTCRAISEMDKSAGLSLKGFNFYRETIMTKEAAVKSALLVKVDGKDVPYEKIEKLGKSRISQYIGADIAKEMDSGPANFKSVVETLPLDLQRVLSNLLKNV